MSAFLLGKSREDSTQATYSVYVKHFIRFCKQYKLKMNLEQSVVSFLTFWFCKSRSYAGCRIARYAIAAYLLDNGFDCTLPWHVVTKLLKAIKRLAPIPYRKQRTPIPVVLLKKMVNELQRKFNTRLLHDCTLIAVGLRTMGRGTELSNLCVDDVNVAPNGFTVRFKRTKTKKTGRAVLLTQCANSCCPVTLLRTWLKWRKAGYLFGMQYKLDSQDITGILHKRARQYIGSQNV